MALPYLEITILKIKNNKTFSKGLWFMCMENIIKTTQNPTKKSFKKCIKETQQMNHGSER